MAALGTIGTLDAPETIELRAVEAPFQGFPTTWAMDIPQDALPLPTPAAPKGVEVFPPSAPKGFWNNVPPEEESFDFSFPSPTDYDRKAIRRTISNGVDIKEMLLLLIATYLLMMLGHLVMLIAG